MALLSAEQGAAISGLARRLQQGVTTPLHPGSRTDAAAIHAVLSLTGKTPDRYPALHQGLSHSASMQAPSSIPDHAEIGDLGPTASGAATSTTLVSNPGAPLISGATTVVLDALDGTPLAHGSVTDVGTSALRVRTDPGGARNAADRMTAVTLFHSQPSASEPPRFGAVARTISATTSVSATVTDPCKQGKSGAEVRIGLGRGQYYYDTQSVDCDYWYDPSTDYVESPDIWVPCTGTATISDPVNYDPTTKQINGLGLSSTLFLPGATLGSAPRACVSATNMDALKDYAQPTDKGIAWGFTSTTNVIKDFPQYPPGPIHYGPTLALRATTSYFLLTFTVPTTQNGVASSCTFYVCSTDYASDSSTNCFDVPDLCLVWCCIAAGTPVTLADGSSIPIEETKAGMRVRTGFGDGTLAVDANWFSGHDGPVLRLVTEGGHTLVATDGHPVMTPEGPVRADDLRAGHHVIVDGGSAAALTAVEQVHGSGPFWNLFLGDASDRARGRGHSAGTFVANGIVVGDMSTQVEHHRATRTDPDYMKAGLPEAFHRDYESALEDASI